MNTNKLFRCLIVSVFDKNSLEKNRGFTLIELLVVIGILSVLFAALIIAINPIEQLAKAKDAGKKSSISQIGRAILNFKTSNDGNFPNETTWDQDLISRNEISVLPKNPSDDSGCNKNLKPGPQTGWCYQVYLDNSTNTNHGLLYAQLDSRNDQMKCNINIGETAYYVWASINGGSGIYCSTLSDLGEAFNDHKSFVGE